MNERHASSRNSLFDPSIQTSQGIIRQDQQDSLKFSEDAPRSQQLTILTSDIGEDSRVGHPDQILEDPLESQWWCVTPRGLLWAPPGHLSAPPRATRLSGVPRRRPAVPKAA